MSTYGNSELVVSPGNRIYHLDLHPDELAKKIILVGDPGRVALVASLFDSVEVTRHNREFYTQTGYFKGKRVSVLSTGIGTDNIDIVLNELDALVNIDLETRTDKPQKTSLDLVRIGTSGALHPDIAVGSDVAAGVAAGLDGMLYYYADTEKVVLPEALAKFKLVTGWKNNLPTPYFVKANEDLLQQVAGQWQKGITFSAPGFYGPQGRQLRLEPADKGLNAKMAEFTYQGLRATNYEMESSALYGLSAMLGHRALTVCKIIANRYNKTYLEDYKKQVKALIEEVLEKI